MALAFHELGAGAPVAFLHGCPGTYRTFLPLAERVAHRCRSILIESPGYGQSPRLEPFSFAGVRECIEDTLVALVGAEPVIIVGFSLGGYHALSVALSRRVRVRGLLLLSPLFDFDDGERQYRDETARALLGADRLDTPDLLSVVRQVMLSEVFAAKNPEAIAEVDTWLASTTPGVFCDELFAMARIESVVPRLAQLDVPTRVLLGSLDAVLPVERSRRASTEIPGGAVKIVDGVGHSVQIEDLDRCAATLLDLLDDLT